MPLSANYHLTLPESLSLRAVRALNSSTFKGSWRIRTLLRAVLKPSRDIICQTAFGPKIIVNPQQDPYQEQIFLDGYYEPGTLALMTQVLRSGDVFVDVGANIGLMSLAASQAVGANGTVVSIEPEPGTFRRLVENIELNRFHNIAPIQVALGANKEIREIFNFPAVNIGRTSLIKNTGAVPSGEVSVHKLDDILDEKKIDKIKMIKIDVEGFEYNVLAGAQRCLHSDAPPILCIECDDEMPREPSVGGMKEINELILGTRKYQAYQFVDSKFSKNFHLRLLINLSDVPRHDNIIYLPIVLRSALSHLIAA